MQSVAYSPAGQTLATGDGNNDIFLWNTANDTRTATLADPNQGSSVVALAFSPDGKELAEGDDIGGTYLWNLATDQMIAAFNDPGSSGAVAWLTISADGTTLAEANQDNDNNIYIWDVASDKVAATLTDPNTEGPNTGVFSPDGQTLAVGDENGGTYLWDIASRSVIATLTGPRGGGVTASAFSPDGQTLATGDTNDAIYVWNAATHSLAATLAVPAAAAGSEGVAWIALGPDGQELASVYNTISGGGTAGPEGSTAYLWNTATSRITATMTDPSSQGVIDGALSPDGQTLATADWNGSAYLWQMPAG
jgi:WD40 repeat protein